MILPNLTVSVYGTVHMKRAELLFSVLLVPVDFVMLLVAGTVAYLLRTRILDTLRPVQFTVDLPFQRYIIFMLPVALAFIICYAISGLYSLRSTRSTIEEFFRVAVASSAGIMGIIIYIFLRQELFNSRFLVLGAWLFAIIFVVLGRAVIRRIQRFTVINYGYGAHRVLIIGDDTVSRAITAEMRREPAFGYRVVKQITSPSVEDVASVIGNPGVDEVILADPNYPAARVSALVDFCHEHHLIFKFVPNLHQTLTANFGIDSFIGVPLVELKRTALEGWGAVLKRATDIGGSLFGLIILIPVWLIIALAIKWESAGPVFVALERVSRNRHFKLYKFRSMINNAEQYKAQLQILNERKDSPLFKIKNDPRITRVGQFIRRYRIDELPQLWNVLKGDMSLVGPRPHQPDEIKHYQKHHRRVLAIKAGVTGMAQIAGSSGLPFEEEVAVDTLYIERWSFLQDIKILILTILKVFRDTSAV